MKGSSLPKIVMIQDRNSLKKIKRKPQPERHFAKAREDHSKMIMRINYYKHNGATEVNNFTTLSSRRNYKSTGRNGMQRQPDSPKQVMNHINTSSLSQSFN